jgi:4-amino-4-deoxy-L-arabinose transferase-like glycosyltransferase
MGLAATYKIFPDNTTEYNTRVFMNTLGILLLLAAFIFFAQNLGIFHSLIITALLALNPIISFVGFLTVYDTLLILIMFISLIMLTKYKQTQKPIYLYLAGIIFGIGNASKYSLFLWFAPLSVIFLYSKKQKLKEYFKDASVLLGLSILLILTNRTSIYYLPTNPAKAFALIFLWIIFYIALYFIIQKLEKYLINTFDFLIKYKNFTITAIIILTVPASLFLRYSGIADFGEDFLTDMMLIANFEMYKYMFFEQFRTYATPIIFYMGFIGAFLLYFVSKERNVLQISIAFIIASVLYWIAASKVIFFHNYYTLIMMITFCILVIDTYLLCSKNDKDNPCKNNIHYSNIRIFIHSNNH